MRIPLENFKQLYMYIYIGGRYERRRLISKSSQEISSSLSKLWCVLFCYYTKKIGKNQYSLSRLLFHSNRQFVRLLAASEAAVLFGFLVVLLGDVAALELEEEVEVGIGHKAGHEESDQPPAKYHAQQAVDAVPDPHA